MNDTPEVTTAEAIQQHAGNQSMEKITRPAHWGVDRDPSRRPGVPMMRAEPREWPNTRFPPEQQEGESASPRHGRTNKTMPPVFSTAIPLRGLSGVIRRMAYRHPDHLTRHWLMKMLADRVDSWEHRTKKYLPVLLPVALLVGLGAFGGKRRRSRRGLLGFTRHWN